MNDNSSRPLARTTSGAPLVARPQRLGILPTLSFWNRRENWRPVRYPMAGVAVGAMAVNQLVDPPLLIGGLTTGLAVYLSIGVMERVLRWGLSRRRKRYEELEKRLEAADGERARLTP